MKINKPKINNCINKDLLECINNNEFNNGIFNKNIASIKISSLTFDSCIFDNIDFNNIKNDIRERLGKYFYVETECKPMIIAVIQEI